MIFFIKENSILLLHIFATMSIQNLTDAERKKILATLLLTVFIDLLGVLWDYDGIYKARLKNSKSVFIKDPTVSLLGGNTSSNFAKAFPPEVIEQGFLSRLLLISGKPTGVKIDEPQPPSADISTDLQILLREITLLNGPVSKTKEATEALAIIYRSWNPLQDARFTFYSSRRFTHLQMLH